MTEEIIIDGVNVAGCGAYKDKHCKDKTSIMFCDTNLCSNYPNCYYKQLKRLEQKNFELEESLKVFNKPDVKKVLTLYNCGEIARLEQENERLKEEKEKYKPFYELGAKCTQLNEVADSLNNLNSKYKSALEEIKDLLSRDKYYEGIYKDVLNKINEVLQ
jgi:hypothetical protein